MIPWKMDLEKLAANALARPQRKSLLFDSSPDGFKKSRQARRASGEKVRRTFRTLSLFPVKRNAASRLFVKPS
ncbi:MAG: hypothetical protein KKA60_10505 [Proteobacteria bacterium]|nr:hypothetical protein [Pseudomonadota bacterium]